jgi:hypothetical protein
MNGHLRHCRSACFAKRAERVIASATGPREALSGPHVQITCAPVRCSRRLATHFRDWKCRKSPKGASDSLLRDLQGANVPVGPRTLGAPRFLNRLGLRIARKRS